MSAGTLIILIILVGIGMGFFALKLNASSVVKYGYKPVNIGTVLAGVIPSALFFITIGNENPRAIMFFTIAIIGLGMIFWRIAKKTDEQTALLSVLSILFASVALLLVVMAVVDSRSGRYDDDWH